jgi:hypothetical protein
MQDKECRTDESDPNVYPRFSNSPVALGSYSSVLNSPRLVFRKRRIASAKIRPVDLQVVDP